MFSRQNSHPPSFTRCLPMNSTKNSSEISNLRSHKFATRNIDDNKSMVKPLLTHTSHPFHSTIFSSFKVVSSDRSRCQCQRCVDALPSRLPTATRIFHFRSCDRYGRRPPMCLILIVCSRCSTSWAYGFSVWMNQQVRSGVCVCVGTHFLPDDLQHHTWWRNIKAAMRASIRRWMMRDRERESDLASHLTATANSSFEYRFLPNRIRTS